MFSISYFKTYFWFFCVHACVHHVCWHVHEGQMNVRYQTGVRLHGLEMHVFMCCLICALERKCSYLLMHPESSDFLKSPDTSTICCFFKAVDMYIHIEHTGIYITAIIYQTISYIKEQLTFKFPTAVLRIITLLPKMKQVTNICLTLVL